MLTGDLVRLRPLEPSDAEAHYRWNHDPDVGQWLAHSYPVSREVFVAEYADRAKNSYERTVVGVETLADDRLIGLVVLSGAEPARHDPHECAGRCAQGLSCGRFRFVRRGR